MQFQHNPRPHARFNHFHTQKHQLVGQQIQPAWKANAAAAAQKQASAEAAGSKIFLSRLPTDVAEKEVEELFKKTVGPVKDCFLIYNSQGNSKGMAVVSFAKASDAASAKAKYHGKIVDGRKPLKIEIIVDDVPKAPVAQAAPAAQPLSLLQRLGGLAPAVQAPAPPPRQQPIFNQQPPRRPVQPQTRPIPVRQPVVVPVGAPRRKAVKKGPKRVQKRALTAAELDQEMDEYQKTALLEVEMTSS